MSYERKYVSDVTLKTIWEKYKEEKIKPDVSEKVFKGILYDLNKTISNMIIKESMEYRIPHKLGFLRIKKGKLKVRIWEGKMDVNKNIIDWKSTLEYWKERYGTSNRKELKAIKDKKVIFQSNEHTNGEVMRWYWDRNTCNVPNKSVYGFIPIKGGIDKDNNYSGRLGLARWINSEDKTNDYYY